MALRTPLSVTPHLYMGDSTGRPLDMGTVYFGEQDKDPEFYPINLFSDDALTLPLAQPVHTKGGYLYDKGDMVEPHAKEIIYSVKVLDSYGRKVFYKGAMMRNSWNDDVIDRIGEGLIAAGDKAQAAFDVAAAKAQAAFDVAAAKVTANAAQAVEAAIDGVAIDANLVTDALITTSIRKPNQVVRTQASKNADFLNVKDFGGLGDGSGATVAEWYTVGSEHYRGYADLASVQADYPHVTGSTTTIDYAATMAAINSVSTVAIQDRYKTVATVYFPKGMYIQSETINLHGTCVLRGDSTMHSIGESTIFEFPNGKDGIIVNSRFTDGATGIDYVGYGADGSEIDGIAVQQKGYWFSSGSVLDYNPSDNSLIVFSALRHRFPEGTAINCRDVTQKSKDAIGQAVLSNMVETTHIISVDGDKSSIAVGSTITGSVSGAIATVVYTGKDFNVLGVVVTSGSFTTADLVGGLKVTAVQTQRFQVYNVTVSSGIIKKRTVITEQAHYGTGFILRSRATLRNCQANYWADDGLSIYGSEGRTNANCSVVDGFRTYQTGLNGISTVGGDSNACRIYDFDVVTAGGYGINDNSFLGNYWFGGHVAVCGLGAYYNEPSTSSYSVFVGCYSEGLKVTAPFDKLTSSFGICTTVIGGTRGDGYDTSKGFSELRGRYFRASNALDLQNVGQDGRLGSDGSFVVTANSGDSKHIAVETAGVNLVGEGASYTFRLPSGTKNVQEGKSNTIYGGSLKTSWDSVSGSVLDVSLIPKGDVTAGRSIVDATGGGTPSPKAVLFPIIENGVITSIDIIDSGKGYTSVPTVRGVGDYAGLATDVEVFNGSITKITVTSSPTGLQPATPIKVLSLTSKQLLPAQTGTVSLGSASNRFSVLSLSGGIGVFGATVPTTKPTITGSKTDGTALESLLTALSSYGLITDSTT